MSSVDAALEALRQGKPIAILDSRDREGETDLFFPATVTHAPEIRFLRTQAGGELYIAIGHEVTRAFGLPYAGTALQEAAEKYPVVKGMAKHNTEMCQGSCSVGLSLDHRSTKTGAPDDERSYTVRRLAELYAEVTAEQSPVSEAAAKLGEEFHLPGHIFLCQENPKGIQVRTGHTELSVALAKAANITPVLVGCVMLSNGGEDYGALKPGAAAKWAMKHQVPFVEGPAVVEYLLDNANDQTNGHVGPIAVGHSANGHLATGHAANGHLANGSSNVHAICQAIANGN